MLTYLKKANLVLVLMLVISLSLPGNVKAAPEARASFGKSSPKNHAENVGPFQVKLSWGSISGIWQYFYCYYSKDVAINVCDINDRSTWLSNGTSTSVQLPTLRPATKYNWQVAAKLKNNDLVWADGSLTSTWTFTTGSSGVAGAGHYDDVSSKWVYAGTWTTLKPTEAMHDTVHRTSKVGASAEIAFNGSRFVLFYTTRASGGAIKVYVDGSLVDTIDAYSDTIAWQQIYRSPIYSQGNHVVRFEHAGDAGSLIDIDAIQIFKAPLQAGVYDDTNSNWFYRGSWTTNKPTEAANDTIHKTETMGDFAEIAFNGSRFVLTYAKRPNRGWINIYVDENLIDTIDAYSATTVWQATWSSPVFKTRNHIVRFEHADAAGIFIDIDAIQIFGAPLALGSYDDTSSNWFYSKNWLATASTKALNQTIHTTSTAGNYAEFAFNGSRFVLTYLKKPNRGSINVYIDGDPVPVDTINASSATVVWGATWVSPLLTPRPHLVRLEHAGAAGTYIDIDAIQVIGTPVSAGTYDDVNRNWFYLGNWFTATPMNAENDTIHKTGTAGDYAEFSFNGSRIVLIYMKRSNRGLINIYVDGNPVDTIDASSATVVWGATWTYTVPAGPHTVTFEHAGAAGTYIDIDAIKILP